MRLRVEGQPNTTLRQRCRVQEILATSNGEAITGVRYENANGTSEITAADLVVDASGRGASTLGLLKSMGRPLPEETTIGIDLGYATCVFAVPDDAPTDWKGVMTFGRAPQNSRGGLMLPLEGNRWMTTIGGRHGDVPPGDVEGFLSYAKALRTPTIYNAIKHAKCVDGAAIEGFADANAITVVGWYYDKAVRGSDPATARPGFADMLAAIAADSVRTSIVETPDRFARDLAMQLAGHDHLKRLGVTLIPASAPDHFVGDELQTLIVMPPETLRRQAARRVSLRVLEERGAISLSS